MTTMDPRFQRADIGKWGYTTKTQLAITVDAAISSRISGQVRYFAYFTTELNASESASTSNPWAIFQELDDAVKFGATRHPKVASIRERLAVAVTRNLSGVDEALKDDLVDQTNKAVLDLFTPVMWKFSMPLNFDCEYLGREYRTRGYIIHPEDIQTVMP